MTALKTKQIERKGINNIDKETLDHDSSSTFNIMHLSQNKIT